MEDETQSENSEHENITPEEESQSLPPVQFFERLEIRFKGNGSRYFAISVINFIFIVITLGLYYPWAKANNRYYLWNATDMNGSRFVFHGKGFEMFKGFLLAYGLILFLNIAIFFSANTSYAIVFLIAFYLVVLILTPMAMLK